jgi:glycosyltransferase involved in cell wall biosynthesis
LPPDEVNRMMNRAKVNVLWSRREGFNRAVIEGMFAGLPCVMRAGFNYGHHHDYVNPATGRYADEAELPTVLADMVDNHTGYSPREWALAHMTCQHATTVLEEHIRREAERRGDPWSGGLVPHITVLHGNRYLDERDNERFAADYEFLASMIRRPA